ncbi:hypothetical protein NKH77_28400 [Streptomyces sp. M19]
MAGRSAGDALFGRVREWAGRIDERLAPHVALLHGLREFNPRGVPCTTPRRKSGRKPSGRAARTARSTNRPPRADSCPARGSSVTSAACSAPSSWPRSTNCCAPRPVPST